MAVSVLIKDYLEIVEEIAVFFFFSDLKKRQYQQIFLPPASQIFPLAVDSRPKAFFR